MTRFWFVAGWAAMSSACIVASRGSDGGSTPSDPIDGQVQLSWRVGPSTCEEAGISSVEVLIGQEAAMFPCTDLAGSISVPAGSYGLELIGYDADNLPRYGAAIDDVSVYGGQVTTVPTLILSSLPATVSAIWSFDNGRLCGYNGVVTVDLNLFDTDDTVKAQSEVPCEDGEAILGEVEAGDYVLVAYGKDADGVATHRGEVTATVGRGESAVLDILLALEGAPE